MIEQLVYASTATAPMPPAAIDALLEQCRANNQGYGLTGFLLFDGKTFFQLLEGDTKVVERIYSEKIASDPRHTALRPLIRQSVKSPAFSNWSMAYALLGADRLKTVGGSMNRESMRDLAAILSQHENTINQLVADFLRELVL